MADPSLTEPYVDKETLIVMYMCCICCNRFTEEELYKCGTCKTPWDTCVACGFFNPCIRCENTKLLTFKYDKDTDEMTD